MVHSTHCRGDGPGCGISMDWSTLNNQKSNGAVGAGANAGAGGWLGPDDAMPQLNKQAFEDRGDDWKPG
jgi:hypothetical protein